jgi:predicted ATPase
MSHGKTHPEWLAGGMIYRGWALAEQGQLEEGIAQIHQGTAAWNATGEGLGRANFPALLAEAHGEEGQIDEGLAAVAEGLAAVDDTGARNFEAELYRLKGELTLQSGVQNEAVECFQEALNIARRQQAKSLELRAAVSLACLWHQQSKRDEAHKLLADIYG